MRLSGGVWCRLGGSGYQGPALRADKWDLGWVAEAWQMGQEPAPGHPLAKPRDSIKIKVQGPGNPPLQTGRIGLPAAI